YGSGVVDQSAQDASPALGRLVEEEESPVLGIRQWFSRQLVILKLIAHLDRILEGSLERGHLLGTERHGRFKQQAVAPVFDKRDHALCPGTQRVSVTLVSDLVLTLLPVATF